MKTCTAKGCTRKMHARGLCGLHYDRQHYGRKPRLLCSSTLRRVPLDDVAVNWLLGVFERLPRRAQ